MTYSKMFNLAAVIVAIMQLTNASTPDEIIGGTQVPAGNYQFLTSLQTTASRHFCGGSLVADDWVLTAAHCVSGGAPSSFQIRLGTTTSTSGGIVVRPSRVIVHESYNANNIQNDIALIQLSSPVTSISPITMDTSSSTHQSGSATVAGWGLTSGGASSTPSQMREVSIPIVSDATCRRSSLFNTYLTEDMICTGFVNGNRGSCNGDSGGPLFQGSTQIGLVSWGARGCTSYSVFTQVNKYRSWIASKIGTGSGGGGGGSDACQCIGSGLDVGSTCGNWLNAGFNWCYSDTACPGSTPSQRYSGYHWFRCSQSRLDNALVQDLQLNNYPMTPISAEVTEDFEAVSSGSSTPSLLTGVAIGVAAAGVASAGAFLVFRNKKNAEVDQAINRVEEERRVVSAKIDDL